MLAVGADAPVDDFCLIDNEASDGDTRRWLEARGAAVRAIDVDRRAAVATDEVVMIVAHTTLEPSRGAWGFYPTDDVFF